MRTPPIDETFVWYSLAGQSHASACEIVGWGPLQAEEGPLWHFDVLHDFGANADVFVSSVRMTSAVEALDDATLAAATRAMILVPQSRDATQRYLDRSAERGGWESTTISVDGDVVSVEFELVDGAAGVTMAAFVTAQGAVGLTTHNVTLERLVLTANVGIRGDM